MAPAKIPDELKLAHKRLYMSQYRQRKKRQQFASQLTSQAPTPPPATITHTTKKGDATHE